MPSRRFAPRKTVLAWSLVALLPGCGARTELLAYGPLLEPGDASPLDSAVDAPTASSPPRDSSVADTAVLPDADANADAPLPKGPALAIAAGGDHSFALLISDAVVGWGDDGFGQLGNGTDSVSTPSAVLGLPGVVAVATGENASYALLSSGSIASWGDNAWGELGIGMTTANDVCELQSTCATTPGNVSDISNAVAVTAGDRHACALLADGTVECWGDSTYGELGIGTTTGPDQCSEDQCSTLPLPVSNLTGVVAIAAGGLATCALLASGEVTCWGKTPIGTDRCDGSSCALRPVLVPGVTGAVAVAMEALGACVLLSNGTVDCWGANDEGQLGDGTMVDSLTPVSVLGVTGVVAVAAGGGHACALLRGGTVECWGDDGNGELGNGTIAGCLGCGFGVPAAVSLLSNVRAVAAGDSHTCAAIVDGGVECWGGNSFGQLGEGPDAGPETCNGYPCSTTPVPVSF